MLKRGKLSFDPRLTFEGSELTKLFENAEIVAPASWPLAPIVGVNIDATYISERSEKGEEDGLVAGPTSGEARDGAVPLPA